MRLRRLAALTLGILLATGATVTTTTASAPPAQAAPSFQLPFPCGQTWSGQTRTNHNPQRSIDFNRGNDLGDPVVASAAGTVTVVRNLGNTSYGRYVVVDHGGGWTTSYAHLNSQSVSVGQRVAAGARLGTVGSTGGSTGPHLHFEQRQNGSAVSVRFNGSTALYWGTRSYTSQNSCGGGGGGGGGGTATGTIRTGQGGPLTVRSSASTSANAAGTVASGSTVTIQCQTTGSSVTGYYGTSTVWNRIGSGRFVSDAYTYTGSDGFVAPRC